MKLRLNSRLAFTLAAVIGAAALLLGDFAAPSASTAAASRQAPALAVADNVQLLSKATKQKLRQERRRARRAATAPALSSPVVGADCESSLNGWNIAGVGEVVPNLQTGNVRSGSSACRVSLSGELDRSELILGGNGGRSTAGMVEFEEGDEYWYGFSIDILKMTYGKPGAHNLFMQFKSEGEGSPAFGLQLWDVDGNKGLWSHSTAMGGDRFLAPISENAWHDIAIQFKASSVGAGFYRVYLDGQLIDARDNVSMILPGCRYAYIKDGLYRNGGTNPGDSEILLDSARLGPTLASVLPA